MSAAQLCWPLPAWMGSGVVWFVLLNVIVGAIFALSTRAQSQSPSPRRGITRRASSVLLQRLRSFSMFPSPSSGFHTAAPDSPSSPAAFRGTEEAAGTTPRRRSPLTPRAVAQPAAAEPTTPAKEEADEEVADSMSMDDVYALVLAGRQRPAPTEEEAARSEVDARAEEFIRGFKEDLRQQRLDSIFNYTQMLKQRAASRRQPAAAQDTNH
uniref:Uncharacterized protein n=1 Tax=Avena sativa TaxID=4498 RepID=A0ACD5XRG5_AVESA